MRVIIESFNCQQCGAPLDPYTSYCLYCRTPWSKRPERKHQPGLPGSTISSGSSFATVWMGTSTFSTCASPLQYPSTQAQPGIVFPYSIQFTTSPPISTDPGAVYFSVGQALGASSNGGHH